MQIIIEIVIGEATVISMSYAISHLSQLKDKFTKSMMFLCTVQQNSYLESIFPLSVYVPL